MNPNSTFIVDLSDLELSSKEIFELQEVINKSVVSHLKGSKKGLKYLEGKVAQSPGLAGLTPHPDWPYPHPWPPRFPMPRPFPGFRALDKRFLEYQNIL